MPACCLAAAVAALPCLLALLVALAVTIGVRRAGAAERADAASPASLPVP